MNNNERKTKMKNHKCFRENVRCFIFTFHHSVQPDQQEQSLSEHTESTASVIRVIQNFRKSGFTS